MSRNWTCSYEQIRLDAGSPQGLMLVVLPHQRSACFDFPMFGFYTGLSYPSKLTIIGDFPESILLEYTSTSYCWRLEIDYVLSCRELALILQLDFIGYFVRRES